jgi:hypothetical protein
MADSRSLPAAAALIQPLFLDEEAAAAKLGWTLSELRRSRRVTKDGPPFVMHGQKVRYGVADLERYAAGIKRFTSQADVLTVNPKRAETVARLADSI